MRDHHNPGQKRTGNIRHNWIRLQTGFLCTACGLIKKQVNAGLGKTRMEYERNGKRLFENPLCEQFDSEGNKI